MERYYRLDWLSITLPYNDVPEEIIPSIPGLERSRDIRPMGYYNSAYECLCGAMVRWHTDIPSQGVNVQLTGSNLSKLLDMGCGDGQLIQAFYGVGAKVARLDYACDMMGQDGIEAIRELINDFRNGRCVTQIRQVSEFKSEDKSCDVTGDTLYLGSKKGDKFVRVYDKAKEMKLLSQAWTRVELQTRGRIADTLFDDMASRERGYAPSEVARRWIVKHCHFPECQWWLHLFAQDVVGGDVSKLPRKLSNFEAYLDQVKKAIANRMDTDRELIEEFLGDVAALFNL